MSTIGSHCILELYDCPASLLDDQSAVLHAIRTAATASGATLLRDVAHRFEPHGVTALGLLAESHISVHTWPELGYVACDVFTCGTHTQPKKACDALAVALGAGRVSLRQVARGKEAPSQRPKRVPVGEEVA